MDFKLNSDHRRIIAGCAPKDDRAILQCVHIKKGLIEVANGFVLVQKPIDYDGEEGILLAAKDLKTHKDCEQLRGVYYVKNGTSEVKAIGESTYILNTQEGKFPETSVLWPTTKPVFEIGLSKKVLESMLASLDKGTEAVKLVFHTKNSPVEFYALDESGTKGLIMPYKLER